MQGGQYGRRIALPSGKTGLRVKTSDRVPLGDMQLELDGGRFGLPATIAAAGSFEDAVKNYDLTRTTLHKQIVCWRLDDRNLSKYAELPYTLSLSSSYSAMLAEMLCVFGGGSAAPAPAGLAACMQELLDALPFGLLASNMAQAYLLENLASNLKANVDVPQLEFSVVGATEHEADFVAGEGVRLLAGELGGVPARLVFELADQLELLSPGRPMRRVYTDVVLADPQITLRGLFDSGEMESRAVRSDAMMLTGQLVEHRLLPHFERLATWLYRADVEQRYVHPLLGALCRGVAGAARSLYSTQQLVWMSMVRAYSEQSQVVYLVDADEYCKLKHMGAFMARASSFINPDIRVRDTVVECIMDVAQANTRECKRLARQVAQLQRRMVGALRPLMESGLYMRLVAGDAAAQQCWQELSSGEPEPLKLSEYQQTVFFTELPVDLAPGPRTPITIHSDNPEVEAAISSLQELNLEASEHSVAEQAAEEAVAAEREEKEAEERGARSFSHRIYRFFAQKNKDTTMKSHPIL